MGEYGGHSGRVTPVPIPNTADKPVHVPYCTEVREPSGTLDSCHIHLNYMDFNCVFANFYFFVTIQLGLNTINS